MNGRLCSGCRALSLLGLLPTPLHRSKATIHLEPGVRKGGRVSQRARQWQDSNSSREGAESPKHTVPWIYTLGIYDSSVRQSDATIASYTKSSGQLMTGYSFLGLTTPSCQTVPFWLEAGSICLQFPCTSDYPVLGLHAQFFQWRGSIGSRAPINKLRAGS